jgi:GntR family transcriptional regulator
VKKAAARSTVPLDDSPGVVRYVQLASFIRHKIVANEWPVGSMLPTVQEFSEQLGIARVTVRQAYAILVREGLISSERGRGTQVTASPATAGNEIRAAINNWLDVPDGFKIRMLEKQAGVALPAQLLLSGAAAKGYMRLTKLHLHGSQIICLAEFYIESAVFSRFPKGSEQKSKIAWLLPKHSKQNMKFLHQVITVSQADHEMARILKYPFAAPIATVKRCITNDAGTVIYASTTWYRGDHFVFDMTLPVGIMYGKQLNTGRPGKKKRPKD